MENVNVPELVDRLDSDEDSARKMAVFKLQSVIGDPSFADVFIQEGGLPKLRSLCLHATGNTLAYSLTSFSRLLELDMGWEYISQDMIERAVELIATQPLVNILRGAMSILVAIVSHPYNRTSEPGAFGFRALKPAVAIHSHFLEMLVDRLSSADHALTANALQLINALMRDAITNDSENDWPKFIKKLQDLGVIKAVYVLMQGTALQDLAQPLLEFQSLTKVLLRKWREVRIDLDRSEHRRALKNLHLSSNPPKKPPAEDGTRGSRKHHPEKWRRLGFETESPAWEFEEMGFLGMMDLTDFVRKHEDQYQKLLLEQSTQPAEKRCPMARASLAVTAILYEHFEVDRSDSEDVQRYVALDARSNFDKAFKPLLLQWSRLHTSGLNAFLRLWKATGAEHVDFEKVEELVRILVEQVVGQAPRTKDVQEVEEDLASFDYRRLRDLQMELLELTYEDAWGHHLRQIRDELNHEALQFVKEQRIRCLLQGAWFQHHPNSSADAGPVTKQNLNRSPQPSWRFARLSHNRRYLHYADLASRTESEPALDALQAKIDLSLVSSVVSNVSASTPTTVSSAATLKTLPTSTSTKITIHGYVSASSTSPTKRSRAGPAAAAAAAAAASAAPDREVPLLHLHPQSHTLASEWLDGLLMLLNQQPITADTNRLVGLVVNYGLKIRLLNVRFDDALPVDGGLQMPSREGVDDDYFYEIGGMEGG